MAQLTFADIPGFGFSLIGQQKRQHREEETHTHTSSTSPWLTSVTEGRVQGPVWHQRCSSSVREKKKRTFGYNKILLLEQKLRKRLTAQETAAVLWVQTPMYENQYICSLALHNC